MNETTLTTTLVVQSTNSTFGEIMFKKLTVTGALVACIAFGAAGCGGDNADADPATATASTKAEFIERGDAALCTKTEEVGTAMASIDLKTASRSELETLVFDGILPAVETARDDLASLPAPTGDEGEIDAIIAAMDDGIETTNADPALLIGGPDPFAKADRLISAYGLAGCPA